MCLLGDAMGPDADWLVDVLVIGVQSNENQMYRCSTEKGRIRDNREVDVGLKEVMEESHITRSCQEEHNHPVA